MQANPAELSISTEAIEAVGALAAVLVESLDDEGLDRIMVQSAGYLDGDDASGSAAATAAVGGYLRSESGAALAEEIVAQVHRAVDLSLVDHLSLGFGRRIAMELGLDEPVGKVLTIAGRTSRLNGHLP